LPAVILLVQGAMIAWTAYELYDNATTAYDLVDKFINGELTEEQFEDALISAGIDAVIDVSLGKLKVLEKAYALAKKAGLTDKADNLYRKLVREEVQQANGSGSLSLPSPDYKVPDGYKMVRNADGSATVTGPNGGTYNSTGFYSSDGKPVYRSESGGYFTLDGGRISTSAPTDYTAVPIHHICTNKCNVGSGDTPAWTPAFKEFFDNAGLNIDSEINKIAVPGHRGPHPQAYHQYVFSEISDSVDGIPANSSDYARALSSALARLKVEAVTPGSQVNRWLTGQS
ncbi:AHH domain-containing protein, partial [Thalassospira xiamenensis]